MSRLWLEIGVEVLGIRKKRLGASNDTRAVALAENTIVLATYPISPKFPT
jgi:hypothetical protein